MKLHSCVIAASALSLTLGSIGLKAETALGKAADNKIYGQVVINDLMRENPDLIIASIHTVAPGAKDQTMVASTMDRIGEKDDDEDLVVVSEQATILARSLKEPQKFKVHMPLEDASGKVIGLLVLIFKAEPGNDETHYCERALAIRANVAKRITDTRLLFNPIS